MSGYGPRELAERLSQARAAALPSIVDDATDDDLVEALALVSRERAFAIAQGSRRGAACLCRSSVVWSEADEAGLRALWRGRIDASDRLSLDSLLANLPPVCLAEFCEDAGTLVNVDLVTRRVSDFDEDSWIAVASVNTDIATALSSARLDDESSINSLLDLPWVDGDDVLARLVRHNKLRPGIARQLDRRWLSILRRFGSRVDGKAVLPIAGVEDGETAEILARSEHIGLRQIAAESSSCDSFVRRQLLGDDARELDESLSRAPLNAAEIGMLMDRLRSRSDAVGSGEALMYQPEPLSTKDRLWLLRQGGVHLTRSWLAGETSQDPRPGEIERLVTNPGESVESAADWDMLCREFSWTPWGEELLQAQAVALGSAR